MTKINARVETLMRELPGPGDLANMVNEVFSVIGPEPLVDFDIEQGQMLLDKIKAFIKGEEGGENDT